MKHESSAAPSRLSRLSTVWILLFLYTLLAGLLLQFVVLPYVLPAWHDGDGLLKGMDGPKFHRVAVDLYEEVKADGWSAWRLIPNRQLVSGVAAVFYVLIQPKPWTVLPLNAALNASAAVCMVLMLETMLEDRKKSLIAAMPFFLFPSALTWHTQMHNENYAVPAVIVLLLGWAMLAHYVAGMRRVSVALALVLVAAGSLLQGLVRDYILFAMLALLFLVSAALAVSALVGWRRSRATPQLLRKLGALAVAIGIMLAVTAAFYYPLRAALIEETSAGERTSTAGRAPARRWQTTPWLPRFVDSQIREVAETHNYMAEGRSTTGSGIDREVEFQNAGQVLAYLPRALQIALLSPFPNIWLKEGRKTTSSGLRLAVIPETVVAYACLLALPYFVWKKRRSGAVWVVSFLCLGMLLFYGVAVPNAGALQRFRFPYYLPLVCMGLGGWLLLFSDRRRAEAREQAG